MPQSSNVEITKKSESVLNIAFSDVSQGWEKWLLLSSDRHHDNIHTDHKLEQKHLKQALDRDALIFDFGDLFCAMQGKYDPRSNMDDIRPEDVGVDYLSRIKKHAIEFYEPYAKNIALISKGNHETNVLKRHGVDLIDELTRGLNSSLPRESTHQVHTGGYGGWVKFQFFIQKTRRLSKNMKYHHGSGGGGPVTRGVIQTNRQAVYLPDAHIVVNGHTHDMWHVPIARERLSIAGVISRDILHFIRTGTYKDEYGQGDKGWHIERWGVPKPLGCVWIRLYYDSGELHIEPVLNVE